MTCCTGLDFHTHDSLSGDWSIRDIHASGQCKSLSCLSTWPWRCYPYNWYADSDCRIFNFRLFDLYEDALSQVAFAYHFQGEHLRRYLGQNFLQNFQVSFCSRFHFLDAFQTDNYLTYFSIKSKPINNLWPNLNKKNPTFFFFFWIFIILFTRWLVSSRSISYQFVILASNMLFIFCRLLSTWKKLSRTLGVMRAWRIRYIMNEPRKNITACSYGFFSFLIAFI